MPKFGANALARVLVGAVLGLLAGSCHGGGVGFDGDIVGAPCRGDRDCAERCVRGDRFPDGTCTVRCHHDGECPDGTNCIDQSGGVCLLACERDSHCRDNYQCKNRDREGHGGKREVCID